MEGKESVKGMEGDMKISTLEKNFENKLEEVIAGLGDKDFKVSTESPKNNLVSGMTGISSVDGLLCPLEMKRRVRALRKNQLDLNKVESMFYSKMHELEYETLEQMKELLEKRRDLISGKIEPNEEESVFDIAREGDLSEGEQAQAEEEGPKIQGVPSFWTTIFQTCENLLIVTEGYDLPILKHLTDIEVEMTKDPMGFQLHFHFSQNEYFTNSVLTKTYIMACEIDIADPLTYDGTEIVKALGCSINWKENKNVTKKMLLKRQKHKQTGSIRTIQETVDTPSFFNFFSPPDPTKVEDEDDREQAEENLASDFELGQYIREKVVPKAVLYFTGEAQLMEEMYDSSEDESGEEDESEEHSEDGADVGEGGDVSTVVVVE